MLKQINIPRGKKNSKYWLLFWSSFIILSFVLAVNPTSFKTIEKTDINVEFKGVKEDNKNAHINHERDDLFVIHAGENEAVNVSLNFLKNSFVKIDLSSKDDYIDGDIAFEIYKNDTLLSKNIIESNKESVFINLYLNSSDKLKIKALKNSEFETWAKVQLSKIAINELFLLGFILLLWLFILFLTYRKNQAAVTIAVYFVFLISVIAESITFNEIDVKSILANIAILIPIALLLALLFNLSKSLKTTKIIAVFTALILFVLAFIPIVFISYRIAFNIPLEKEALYSIFQSNTEESFEFLISFVPISAILFVIFTFVFIFYISWWHRNSKTKNMDFSTIFILIITTSIISISYIDNMKLPNFIEQHYKTYVNELQLFKDLQNKRDIDSSSIDASKENIGETYVFIIGESLNKRHMSAYGYPRNTTPLLNSLIKNDEILKFENTYSNHVLTMSTLSLALTEASIGSNKKYFDSASIVDIFKKADFETIWLTNQNLLGAWDNLVSIIANSADQTIGINNSIGTTTRTQNYDGDLIPHLNKILENKTSKNKAIFIHLMGSHLAYCQRFPNEYKLYNDEIDMKTFGKNIFSKKDAKNFINCYDNSVLYNDFVLTQVIESLKKQEGVNALVYMPDHSEEVFKMFAHDPGKFTYNMTQIPFIMWFSQNYKDIYQDRFNTLKANINTLFSNDKFYDTAIGLSGIKTSLYKEQFDLSSNKYFFNEKEASTLHGKIKYAQNDNYFFWQRKNFDYLVQNRLEDKFIIQNINSLGKLHDILNFNFKSFELNLVLNSENKLFIENNEMLSFEDILENIDISNINKIYLNLKNQNSKNSKKITSLIEEIDNKFNVKSKLILDSNSSELIVKSKLSLDNKNFIKDVKNSNITKDSKRMYLINYKSNFD